MKPLTLDMSDPLTLGMGHPVTERIRRLSMRKTNLLTRSGTYAIIIAALGVSAPIFTATAASPVTEAVDNMTKKAVESLDEVSPISRKKVPLKLASQNQSIVEAGLSPMRLRMRLDYDQKHIDEVDVARKAYVKGDKTALKTINHLMAENTRKNRFQLIITDHGQTQFDISDGQRGWPGFPVTAPAWERRPLSQDMQNALKNIIKQCRTKSSPEYFRANLMEGDIDIGKGSYFIECINGPKNIRDEYSDVDLVKAYLASGGLPLSEREQNFDYRMGFAMLGGYVKTQKNATIEDDRKACVRIYEHLKSYDFVAKNSEGIDRLLAKCSTTNYNWVRRRHGVPEIKL